MQIMTTPQLTVGVRKALTRIKILECLIKKIESEGAIVSLDFRIVDGVLEYSTDGGTTWNSTVNLVDELDGDFVTIAGDPQTITGEKTIDNVLNMGGNIVPTPHNTLTLGTESNSFNKVYTENVAYNGALRFSASSGYYFSQNTAFNWNQVIGGFFNPGNQFFVQAPGSVPANRGERFQNYGTSYLGGNVNLAGDIIPITSQINNLGSLSNYYHTLFSINQRVYNIYAAGSGHMMLGPSQNHGLYINNTISSSTNTLVGGFHPTTRNFFLQASGNANADLGHRFQLFGNQYVQGYTDVSVTTATPSGTYSVPISPVVKLTLTSNPTLNFANHTTGLSTTVKLILIQDATGGRTITWGNVKFPGAIPPTLSSTANSRDVLTLLWDGEVWYLDNFIPDVR